MMRYQRVSPDGIPLSNGKKLSLRACKEDDATDINGRTSNYSFDAKPLKPRSVSGSANASTTPDHPYFPDPENQPPTASSPFPAPKLSQNHHDTNVPCSGTGTGTGTGNVLLQWGHNKRSRGSRTTAADEPSGPQPRQTIKIQRRSSAMPPPGPSYTRGANLRPCTPIRDPTLLLLNRTVEERSGGQTRAEKRSPPHQAEKGNKAAGIPNGGETEQEAAGEKVNLDHLEWPRIYVSLSRKEKEDDFLAMKGSKLPQRPKKRAKNVDKILQYCFPGMWLSDLTRGRYEVREKKCVKKKRRGLKGMESMETDSE